ncbi:PadR family transcriptional regulator [Lentilitoribacter sp. EG35]|uniref:PadR family transcriptional regulator n=1 Tax=Lentilitoribacter sp. EG35 TaxID=3234192 RepID=UPI00345F8882
MNIRTLCLAILNFGQATGYEIKKMSSETHYAYFVDASYGSIYPALNKLEAEGFLTSHEEREPGKPARKVYSITEAGRTELTTHMVEPPKQDTFKSEFLLIAMCAELLDRETLVNAIDHRIKQLENDLEFINKSCRETEHEGTKWIADYGHDCQKNSLDYLIKNRKKLESLAKVSSQALTPAE